MFGSKKSKSEDAKSLDNAIRAANARASAAHSRGDKSEYTDASTDLAALRDMRLALNETDD